MYRCKCSRACLHCKPTIAGSSVTEVGAIEPFLSNSSISHIPSSASQQLSTVARASGSAGSGMLFLPAPRDSLLLRAGNHELDALANVMAQVDDKSAATINADGEHPNNPEGGAVHAVPPCPAPRPGHVMSGIQGSEEDPGATLMISGLLLHVPQLSTDGQPLGGYIHHGLDASDPQQVNPVRNPSGHPSASTASPTLPGLQLPQAPYCADKATLTDFIDSVSQVFPTATPTSPVCHFSRAQHCTLPALPGCESVC